VPAVFAAGDVARWPDPRAGRIRVEHWVVAQRQGQTAARNMLGARAPFTLPPFFWSNHFDLHIHYVGHGSGKDRATVLADLKTKNTSVVFRDGKKVTAVASVGADLENLKAEVALEYPDKLYIGTFERTSRFDAHLDETGISLSLHRTGAADVRKSVRMHFHYGLFADILHDLAKTVSSVPPADAAHRDALREGAKALYQALNPRRNDKDDIAQMTPEEEVLLLHVME